VHCVPDCVADGVRPILPQPTEWQRIANQINTVLEFFDKRFLSYNALSAGNCEKRNLVPQAHLSKCACLGNAMELP